MAFQKFFIAPLNEGEIAAVKPWLIPDKAFTSLQNVFAFRGTIRKRPGAQLMNQTTPAATRQLTSRLRIALTGGVGVGQTDGAGNAAGNVPGVIYEIGQLFSIGTQIFTVISNAAGAQPMLNTAGGNATFNAVTGAYNFVGVTANTQIYFYPAEPVMGLMNYETSNVNNEDSVAFDTQFAYRWSGTDWTRLTGGSDTWSDAWNVGSGQFFWGMTWRGVDAYAPVLFVTNNIDNIRFWNGTTWANRQYRTVQAAGAPPATWNTIVTCRLIVVFADRLLLLNTYENIWNSTAGAYQNQLFGNRIRWSSAEGDPTQQNTSFLEGNNIGQPNFLDMATSEQIISAAFVRDRLILYLENSTWELTKTGDPVNPFRVQRINQELGAESTFSIVSFDKVALAIGQNGIHTCNGANAQRIDDKIPDDVWSILDSGFAPLRVSGIRDFYNEIVWWSFPQKLQNPDLSNSLHFNNQILTYNYKNDSWAFFDDSITIFGHWYPTVDGPNLPGTNIPIYQRNQQQVIAGNQQGFVFALIREETRNAPSLQITNIVTGNPSTFTVINHNLEDNDFFLVENVQGATGYNDNIYQVISHTDDTITFTAIGTGNVYTGGGTITRVDRVDIVTKEYNFFANTGKSAYFSEVDFFMDRVFNSAFTVDYYVSSAIFPPPAIIPVPPDTSGMLYQGTVSGAIVGTGVVSTSQNALYPLEAFQERLWHPTFLQAEGNVIQMQIYWSDAQMTDRNIVLSSFQLNAMCIHAMPVGRLQ